MGNKKASDKLTPNPWDYVDLKKGMLTDELARSVVHKEGDTASGKLNPVVKIGTPKIYKRPQSKFK